MSETREHGYGCKCETCLDRARAEASEVPGLRAELARAKKRLAALEAFARAFAGAERTCEQRYFGSSNYLGVRCCQVCKGVMPAEVFPAYLRQEDREVLERPGRGHRPDCARGAAVAAVREIRGA